MLKPEISLPSSTNIHYTDEYCFECHYKKPVGGNKSLKYNGDFKQLCKCHINETGVYIHPVDIIPSKEKSQRLSNKFPLLNGKLSCATCHNLSKLCEQGIPSKEHGSSLRGAPYKNRVEICYQCHIEKKYDMFNPHKQFDENGNIILESCLYCHVEKPQKCVLCHERDQKKLHASLKNLKLVGNLKVICQRCHVIEGNHSGNKDHMLFKPSEKGMKRLNEMEDKFKLILPLDKDGTLTCATCHNPHEKGVVPEYCPGSKGADEKFKHRLPGKICSECHQL